MNFELEHDGTRIRITSWLCTGVNVNLLGLFSNFIYCFSMHRFSTASLNGITCQLIRQSKNHIIHSHLVPYRKQAAATRCLTTTTRRFQDSQQPSQETPDVKEAKDQQPPSLIKAFNVSAPHTGHIRVVTLKSPDNKNAISRNLLEDLRNHIRGVYNKTELEASAFEQGHSGATLGKGTRAIVIGSEVDGVFCAGADLKERKTMTAYEYVSPIHDPEAGSARGLVWFYSSVPHLVPSLISFRIR